MVWRFLTVVFLAGAVFSQDRNTPLDEYVRRIDPEYGYTLLETYVRPGGITTYVLNMTSQRWKDETVSNWPVWWHYMTVVIPDVPGDHPEAAFMLIGLADNIDEPPLPDDNYLVGFVEDFARDTGSVGVLLENVPNQPIIMATDPTNASRIEDAIIGWTFRQFVVLDKGADPEVLLLFPMTKAAVRAMDAVTSFVKETADIDVSKYFLGGPSKRGWTTWLAGAVDDRVFAMAPQVLSLLNFVENLQKHYRSLNGWSWAFKDYYYANITNELTNPLTQTLASYIDPYAFRDRLTMPILYIGAAGDEFFLLDDTNLWWDDIPSKQKYIMMLPNAQHTMLPFHEEIFDNIKNMFTDVLNNQSLPQINWTRTYEETGAYIDVFVDPEPDFITVWRGDTEQPNNRDFRILIGPDPQDPVLTNVTWEEEPERLELISPGRYHVKYDNPSTGWTSFFVQAQWNDVTGSVEYDLSSEVVVIPDTFPRPRCSGDDCRGTIV